MHLLSKEKDILSVKEQYQLCDEILKDRLENLLPQLMKECGVEMWLVLCREYNEDPVFRSLNPRLVKSASRTSCYIFSLNKEGKYEALSLCRPNSRLMPFYKQEYRPKEEDQFEAIARVVKERNPSKVTVNICDDCAQADGLSKLLWDKLYDILGDKLDGNGDLAVRWLETRTQKELEIYPSIYRIAMDVLREAYSLDVITPGVTTTTDVEWYIMQRIDDMGLAAWFSPDVDLQRKGGGMRMSDAVIEKGDLLHTDMGLTYLNLNTDTQRLAYVLKDGETEIPAGILDGFRRGMRFQDIVLENYKEGLSGNEIFFNSVEQAKAEGIRPMLYTHPIGMYGHAAGPTIGLYDNQSFVPARGERKLYKNTCYALELNVTESVPEWDGQDVCFMMEETVAFTGDGCYNFMDGDRDKIIVIG